LFFRPSKPWFSPWEFATFNFFSDKKFDENDTNKWFLKSKMYHFLEILDVSENPSIMDKDQILKEIELIMKKRGVEEDFIEKIKKSAELEKKRN
jgi:hypothetical protein